MSSDPNPSYDRPNLSGVHTELLVEEMKKRCGLKELTSLELTSTEDLVEELGHRCGTCIIAYDGQVLGHVVRELIGGNRSASEETSCVIRSFGPDIPIAGLRSYLQKWINVQEHELAMGWQNQTPTPDNDQSD